MLEHSDLTIRKVTDENFRHCAVTLLPFTAFSCGTLEECDLNIDPAIGVSPSDIINAIRITAEVAVALSIKHYGKPRIRVAAITRSQP